MEKPTLNIPLLIMCDVETLMSENKDNTIKEITTRLMHKYAPSSSIAVVDDSESRPAKKQNNIPRKEEKKKIVEGPVVDDSQLPPANKQKNIPRKEKKKKIVDGPDPNPEMPPEMMKEIKSEEIGGDDPVLLLQKKLMASDLEKSQNRLSIPINQLESTEFLEEAEKAQAEKRGSDMKIKGLQVVAIEPSGEKTAMSFKKWDLKKSSSYVLTTTWHDVSVRNKFRIGQIIQVWFFRDRQRKPCFAFVNLGVCTQ